MFGRRGRQEIAVAIFYVFSPSSSSYISNFIFFYNTAVLSNPDKGFTYDYFLISNALDGRGNETVTSLLQTCPKTRNVKIFEKDNSCFDLGSIGWLLNTDKTILKRYAYFIWVNASVRGPFLAPYAKGVHWTQPLIRNLQSNKKVKLVGPVINCGVPGASRHSKPFPHVQSYVSCTDQEGMEILYNNRVFDCHKTKFYAIEKGEIMASRVLIGMNYTISSLMSNQKIEWSADTNHSSCNSLRDPMQTSHQMEGVPLQLYEILFAKVKPGLNVHSSHTAKVLSKWTVGDYRCLKDLFRSLEQ
ncbi:hypothetical protein M9434_002493 [Picochlorum sp. BPE23]|nr:hypothetical protein M9434_002493 [Picochlorum sp. BPE23]